MTLSVALCTYNGERYIREQLESIFNQTMKVDEIVVCDDGSTDNTLSIIESYASPERPQIRIYRNEKNIGPAKNFQQAINLCTGDIIFLSDQDDVWQPTKVSTIVYYFDYHPNIDTIFSNAFLIGDDGEMLKGTLWDYCFDKDVRFLFDAGLEFDCFAYGNHATGATIAIRKKEMPIIEYNPGFLHDHALAILSANNDSLGYIAQCLTKYRIHSGQVCGITKGAPVTWYDLVHPMHEILSLPLNYDKRNRITFYGTRIAARRSFWGLFKIIGLHKSYKELYPRGYSLLMRMDIKEFAVHKLKHIFPVKAK